MENRKITINNEEVIYSFVRTRGRYVRLSIGKKGLRVSAPRRVSLSFIEQFLHEKSVWIMAQLQKRVAAPSMFPAGHYSAYKARALKLATEKMRHFNQHYNFIYSRITVRNQSTRWGSCSRSGTINFNYRILFLEEALQDYIVVHELCHLQEMNHSARFWKLVGETIPDYKERRRKLRSIHLH